MKKILFIIFCIILLSACAQNEPIDDFAFRVRWNTYGLSSYDSASGVLIKTTHATTPDDFKTTLLFSDHELQEIRTVIRTLDPVPYENFYPDIKDEYKEPNISYGFETKPPSLWELEVWDGTSHYTIKTHAVVGWSDEMLTEQTIAWRNVMQTLIQTINKTKAWKSLPEYEFLYE